MCRPLISCACSLLTAYLLTFGTVACGGGETTGPPDDPGDQPAPAHLSKVAGSNQTDTVADTLPDPLVVEVTAPSGEPIADASVKWETVAGSGTVLETDIRTDGQGRARARWKLGTEAGADQRVEARLPGKDSVTFEAQAVAGAPAQLVLEIDPDSVLAGQTAKGSVTVEDQFGNPTNTAATNLQYSSEDPSVATVTTDGIIRGEAPGSTGIVVSSGEPADTARIRVLEFSGTSESATAVDASVDLPDGTEPDEAYLLSGPSGAVAPQASGASNSETSRIGQASGVTLSFTDIGISTSQTTAVFARNTEGTFGAACVPRNSSGTIEIDPLSTAICLVFTSPLFVAAPEHLADDLKEEVIRPLPEVQEFANVVDSYIAEHGVLPVGNAAPESFQQARTKATNAAEAKVKEWNAASSDEKGSARFSPTRASSITWPFQGDACDSGQGTVLLEDQTSGLDYQILDETAGDQIIELDIVNRYGRNVHLYTVGVSDRIPVPPADYLVDFTSISDWAALTDGEYGAPCRTIVPVGFTKRSPSVSVAAFGLGVKDVSLDSIASLGGNPKWSRPALRTTAFSIVFPAIELTLGTAGMLENRSTLGRTLEAASGVLNDAVCLNRESDAPVPSGGRVGRCLASEVIQYFLTEDLLGNVAQELAGNVPEVLLNQLTTSLKGFSLVATAGDLAVTAYAVGKSRPREVFHLSYNRTILDAANILIEDGNGQTGQPGESLSNPLLVRVLDADSNPVEDAWVSWETVAEGGTVNTADTVITETGAEGYTTVEWTMPDSTGTYQLTARLAGLEDTVQFNAEVVPASSLGDLAVTVSTSGDDPDSNGYTVTVDGTQTKSVEVQDSVLFADLEEGDHQVELGDIASNCTADGENPRDVHVNASDTVSTEFSISCDAQTAESLAYVVNNDSGNVSVIEVASNSVTGTIPVNDFPVDVAFTPDGSKAYVSNAGAGTLSVIDVASDSVIGTIEVDGTPHSIAVAPDGSVAYVTKHDSDAVAVVDVASGSYTTQIGVGREPEGVAFTPGGNKAYVTNSESDNVSVINVSTNSVVDTIPVGNHPVGVAVTPGGNTAYVTGNYSGSDSVSVVDVTSDSVINKVPVGHSPLGIAVTPDGNTAYVSNNNSDNVTVIDVASNSVVNTIPVGSDPWGVAITPDGSTAYVANSRSANVSVIDIASNSVVETIPVGDGPRYGVAVTPN